MSNKGKTLVNGHTLKREGQPHDNNGVWRGRGYWEGRGKCSCGALSDVLSTHSARKRWHKRHKAEVLNGMKGKK